MGRSLTLFFLLTSAFTLSACSSSRPKPEPKYHPATLANDLFPVEQGMPMREVRPQQFFPKKCELADRHPHFSKTEYECTEAP